MGWSALLESHEKTAGGIARDDGSPVCIEAAGMRKPCEQDPVSRYRFFRQAAKVFAVVRRERACSSRPANSEIRFNMDTSKARILFIDDDLDMHLAIRAILGDERYEVTCCRTGAEGLEAMHHARPDLVLLDIMLAQPTEGIQVACQMRQDPQLKDIPIIFISAVGELCGTEYAQEVCPVALEADMFLDKPLDATTVREAVQWVLQQKKTDK